MLAMMSKLFGARYGAYEAGESRKSEFSILPLFLLLPPPINTFSISLIPLLALIYSAVVGFVSKY